MLKSKLRVIGLWMNENLGLCQVCRKKLQREIFGDEINGLGASKNLEQMFESRITFGKMKDIQKSSQSFIGSSADPEELNGYDGAKIVAMAHGWEFSPAIELLLLIKLIWVLVMKYLRCRIHGRKWILISGQAEKLAYESSLFKPENHINWTNWEDWCCHVVHPGIGETYMMALETTSVSLMNIMRNKPQNTDQKPDYPWRLSIAHSMWWITNFCW